MQRESDLGSSSPRQASAQAVQLWAVLALPVVLTGLPRSVSSKDGE
jgi:hypothetical protein